MKPDELSRLDQSIALVSDMLPKQWKRMFDNCMEVGFTDKQSMSLVMAYILSQCPYGVWVRAE